MMRCAWRTIAIVWCALTFSRATVRADAPAGRYVVSADTVQDRLTGLTWQWPVDSFTWEAAKAHCSQLTGGWRLPSLKELLTLVDPTRINPAIDVDAFPGTPADEFWTASPYFGYPDEIWVVRFDEGNSLSISSTNMAHARCVR